MPGMQELLNVIRSINVIQHISRMKGETPTMVISINTEKAFDEIQYPSTIETLRKLGIEKIFLFFLGHL